MGNPKVGNKITYGITVSSSTAKPRENILLILPVFMVFVLGFIATALVGRFADNEMRKGLISRAATAAVAIDQDDLMMLHGELSDQSSAAYKKVQRWLTSILDVNEDAHYVYLFGKQNGKVVFLADANNRRTNETADLPGTVYGPASKALIGSFANGRPFIEGPLADEWGVWYSGLIPVKSSKDGHVMAVLGFDISAKRWHKMVLLYQMIPALLAVAIGTLLICNLYNLRRTRAWNSRLAISEQKYRGLFDHAKEMIFELDEEGKLSSMNSYGESLLGYTTEEIKALDHGLTLVNGNLSHIRETEFDPVHKEYSQHELDMVCKDGRIITVDASTYQVHLDGKLVRIEGFAHDITHLKAMENDLRHAATVAQDASKAKSDFLANMSHEIRTPLNGVVGMSNLLLETQLDERQQRYAHTISYSADLLLSLINDILDFSKIESGKMELESQPFQLHDMVEGLVETFAHRAESKGIELINFIGDEVPVWVVGDQVRVRQILTNIIGNAIKFTDQGEVTVRCDVKSMTDSEATLRFAVSDTGIGISPEAKHRLFNSFTQLDASTTRKYGGTGLGLAISKRLVSMMHGEIGLESNMGSGCTFWFEIPFEFNVSTNINSHDGIKHMRVLVLDDNAVNRTVLSEQLANWGIDCMAASNAQDGLELMSEAANANRKFEVAIVDLQMPDVDGLGFAEMVRAVPKIDDTPLILLGSMDTTLSAPHMQKLSFCACLVKPVRQSQLFDALIRIAHGQSEPDITSAGTTGPDSAVSTDPRRGTPILVVEDNEVNRMVVGEMLRRAGYAYDEACNGREAVDAVAAKRYGLILMDCQMPELDGFEATRLIRSTERLAENENLHIPIVALTANAMHEDRERCIDVGMDDYLCKPIKPQNLFQMIDKWIVRKDVECQSGDSTEKPVDTTPKEQNEAGLGSIDYAQLVSRCGNDLQTVDAVIGMFKETALKTIANMEIAIDAQDSAKLHALAHELKGTAATMAASPLSTAAKTLEQLGDEKKWKEAAECFEQVKHEFALFVACTEHPLGLSNTPNIEAKSG